mgnify:FL=1
MQAQREAVSSNGVHWQWFHAAMARDPATLRRCMYNGLLDPEDPEALHLWTCPDEGCRGTFPSRLGPDEVRP